MSSLRDTAEELSPNLVFFVPLDDGRVVIMLPILPPLVVYNDDGYKRFVNAFSKIHYCGGADEDIPVGEVFVEHERAAFRFSALTSFVGAIAGLREVVVIPYAPEEGLPTHDVFGATVPVIKYVDGV